MYKKQFKQKETVERAGKEKYYMKVFLFFYNIRCTSLGFDRFYSKRALFVTTQALTHTMRTI